MIASPIDEIKNRLDIVEVISSYIKLQKAGANYRALCPFHNEKKPSFFVSPARQIWHCFGSCSEGGDIFKFIMKIEGIEFNDALRILAQRAGVELKKQDPKLKTQRQRFCEILELSCRFFEKQLEKSLKGKEAKEYLFSRGLKEDAVKNWRLGYAPEGWKCLSDFLVGQGYKREEIEKTGLAVKSEKSGDFFDRFRGRIIFPVFNLASQAIGFGARVLGNKKEEIAKYVNSPSTFLYDKSRVLYGLNKAGIEARKKDACVLVEGYMDVILAHQAGFKNVVATSGTALTSGQLNIIKRYSENLLTAFDMDLAGDSATKRGIDLAQAHGFNIKIIAMPKEKDPADVISQNPELWQDLVDKAKSIHDFYFDNVLSKFDKNTLEGKRGISKTILPVIKKIPNKIEQSYWIKSLSEALDIKEEDIIEEFAKVKVENQEISVKELVEKKEPLRKSRKELLEEYLLFLAIRFSENLNLFKKEDFIFLSPQTANVLSCLLNKEKNPSQEIKEKIEYLSFGTEVFDFEDEKSKGDFENCLKEIKGVFFKDKLDSISKEIKKAEQEKNFEKVQQLFNEFHNLCQRKES